VRTAEDDALNTSCRPIHCLGCYLEKEMKSWELYYSILGIYCREAPLICSEIKALYLFLINIDRLMVLTLVSEANDRQM